MGRISREEQCRRDGISYAYRVVKAKGIEGLEADMRRRGILGWPVGTDIRAMNEALERAKMTVVDTVRVMACCVLQDEFDFGRKMVQRFIDRYDLKSQCLVEDLVEWEDLQRQLLDELKIDLPIRTFDGDIAAKRRV